MNGSKHTNSFLGARAYIFLSRKTIQKSFDTNVNKVTRIIISFENGPKINCPSMKKFKIRT